MRKQNTIFVAIIATILVILMWAEQARPKKINWQPSYSSGDKAPYGHYILRQELRQLFPAERIETQQRTIYEALKRNYTARKHFEDGDFNYVFVNRVFSPSETDFDVLMDFVENGGQVFIAAQLFERHVAERLGIKTSYFFINAQDSLTLRMVNPRLGKDEVYGFKRGTVSEYFQKYNSVNTSVLAVNSEDKPVLLKAIHGKGSFILSSTPLAFSNYHMVLANNSEYASKVFSYLPLQMVYWDEYYKDGRIQSTNKFRFIMSRESLRWALWLTIITLVIFIIFEGRRTQRIIPIIKPLPNTTLEFTQTVGKLYYQRKDHKNIAEKRITHFLEYIRTHMYVSTNQFDEAFINKIVSKTSQPKEHVNQLFRLITNVQKNSSITDTELLYLSTRIDQMKAAYEGKPINTEAFFKAQRRFNIHLIFGIFWIVMGAAASFTYAMVSSDASIIFFLLLIVYGIYRTVMGINQHLQRNHYKVTLGNEVQAEDT
ncbi:hypothetical protein BKI52_41560 [marine bacterium AO1-C]|nr:hypothetical protein BKI52_41560 [marine bacterium AO1-C]